jgi:hypothetical protein
MASSYSITRSFTITNARHVTSKIAADLGLMRAYYGWPSENEITQYAEEAAILLNERYLGTVEYGFKRNGKVVFGLKYVACSDGTLQADDRPGRVPSNLNLSETERYSYLTYTSVFQNLSPQQQAEIKDRLPVTRSPQPAPATGSGYWEQSRSYSSNGEGVVRSVFRPL